MDGLVKAVGVKDEDVERGTEEAFLVVTGVGGNDGSGSGGESVNLFKLSLSLSTSTPMFSSQSVISLNQLINQ